MLYNMITITTRCNLIVLKLSNQRQTFDAINHLDALGLSDAYEIVVGVSTAKGVNTAEILVVKTDYVMYTYEIRSEKVEEFHGQHNERNAIDAAHKYFERKKKEYVFVDIDDL